MFSSFSLLPDVESAVVIFVIVALILDLELVKKVVNHHCLC